MRPMLRLETSRLPRLGLHALLLAASFSFFLYSAHFGFTCKVCNTLFGLLALGWFLKAERSVVLGAGFFIGLLWFYWIGFSFEYYNVTYMIPLVSFGFGIVYLLFFGVLALTNRIWLRALLLFGLSFVEPMDFNWMVPELLFLDSYLGMTKMDLGITLAVLTFVLTCKHPWRYGALLLLLFAAGTPHHSDPVMPPLKIKTVATDLSQELKWKSALEPRITQSNLDAIEHAIDEGYELVILPESAFPLFLNLRPDLLEILREKSHRIAIVTGALLYEAGNNYNVTYHFEAGRMDVAKKMVLVPFGEYIPLPAFMRDYVNRTFFDGASDYLSADSPTDFIIAGTPFRNAVCYEATCDELYAAQPRYMIATSNNAWFMPSIEPTLQHLLLRFYARKHHTVIFHAANAAGTGIIRP